MATIESLRQGYDPLANSIPAHITLVFPFDSEMPAADLRNHIEFATRGFKAFELGLAGVSVSEGEYLFLAVNRGTKETVELHDRLYTGPLRGHLSTSRQYLPHLTIGRSTEADVLQEAFAAASSARIELTTRANAVSVYSLGPALERQVEFGVHLT